MHNGLTELTKRITHQATQVAAEMTRMRREIHSAPEAAFSEQATSALAAEVLTAAGWTFRPVWPGPA